VRCCFEAMGMAPLQGRPLPASARIHLVKTGAQPMGEDIRRHQSAGDALAARLTSAAAACSRASGKPRLGPMAYIKLKRCMASAANCSGPP